MSTITGNAALDQPQQPSVQVPPTDGCFLVPGMSSIPAAFNEQRGTDTKHPMDDAPFSTLLVDQTEKSSSSASSQLVPVIDITAPATSSPDHTKQCREAPTSCPNGCHLTGVTGEEGPKSHVSEHESLSMAEHILASVSESCRELQEVSNQRDLLKNIVTQQANEITSLKQKSEKQHGKIASLQKVVANQTDKLMKFEQDLKTTAKKEQVEDQKRDLVAVKEAVEITENKLTKLETLGSRGLLSTATGEAETQPSAQDRQLGIHDVQLAEMDLRFQILETASFDGTLLWKIKDYTRRKHEAVTGRTLSLYSQPFYTSQFGYKMCARVYLNGDGMGKGTHMSLFFVVMRGDHDALLPWPFRQKVTLMLLDQDQGRRHLADAFRPDPTSSSFKRPTSDMNIASGCPLFVSQAVVEGSPYLKDDTIFIKVFIDTSERVANGPK